MLIAQACACYQEEQFYFLWDGMLPDTVGQWGFKKSSSQQWQRNNYKPEKDKVVHMCTDTCIFCIKAINKINILNWLEFPIPVMCPLDIVSLIFPCCFITGLITFNYTDILCRDPYHTTLGEECSTDRRMSSVPPKFTI